jgi:hypothetical protein
MVAETPGKINAVRVEVNMFMHGNEFFRSFDPIIQRPWSRFTRMPTWPSIRTSVLLEDGKARPQDKITYGV